MANVSNSDTRTRYWREQVEAWKHSGKSQRAFCQAHDLDYYRFGYWKKKFRREAPDNTPVPPNSGFISVLPTTGPTDDGLSVTLINGAVINGVSAQNLDTVCLLLARLS